MVTRILFVLGLVTCGIAVLAGAWPGPATSTAPDPKSAFVPKTVSLDPALVGAGIDSGSLLDKASANLCDDEAVWLSTKIWQTGCEDQATFVAEGMLQRGPNQCARLELNVTTNGISSRTTAVCDGHSLAHVCKITGVQPTAEVVKLPELTDAALAANRAAREEILTNRNCGGPVVLLRSIRQHLTNATLQTGQLGDVAVIEIKGHIDPAKLPMFAAKNLTALRAHVYLDAKTLWPCRVEWWGSYNGSAFRQLTAVEYRDPTLGVALSQDECEQMFSYRPEGDEQVSEK